MTLLSMIHSADPQMEWGWTMPQSWYDRPMKEALQYTPQRVKHAMTQHDGGQSSTLSEGGGGAGAVPPHPNIYVVRGNSWAPLDPQDYTKTWKQLIRHMKDPVRLLVLIRQPIPMDLPFWRLNPLPQTTQEKQEQQQAVQATEFKQEDWDIIEGGGGAAVEAIPHQQQLDEQRVANPFRDLLACSKAVHVVYNITEGKTTFSKKSVRVPGGTFHMDHQVTNTVGGQMSEVAVVGRLEFSPHDVRGIVAFRGTLLSNEWFSNAFTGLFNTPGHKDIHNIITKPPTVITSTHSTFLHKTLPQQVNVIRTLKDRILGEIEKYKGLDRWLITGHSRGAAFATAIASFACQRFPDKMFTLVTMAGMPYGREEFYTQLAKNCTKNVFAYHYVSKLDVIPTMNAFRRYFPLHEQIDICLDYNSRFDFVYYHSLDRYVEFARCMIKIQNLLQRWIREMDTLWTGDIPPLDLLLGQRLIQDLLLSTTSCTLSPRLRLKVLERVYNNFHRIYVLPFSPPKFRSYHEYFQLLTSVLLADPSVVHMFLRCTVFSSQDSRDPSDPLSTLIAFIKMMMMMMKHKETSQQDASAIHQSLATIKKNVSSKCKLFYPFLEKFMIQTTHASHVPHLSTMAPRQFHYAYPPRLHSGSIQKQYGVLYPGGTQWEIIIDNMEAFYTFLNEQEFLSGITPSMILRDPVLMVYWVDRFERSKKSQQLVRTPLYETMKRWIQQQSQANVEPPTTTVILASSVKKLETLMGSSTTFMEAVKRCILYHDKQRLELLLYYFLTLPTVGRKETIPPHSSMKEKMVTIAQVRKLLFSPQQAINLHHPSTRGARTRPPVAGVTRQSARKQN